MATLEDLYEIYCRRRGCKPNSSLSQYLKEEYERHNQQRIIDIIDLSKNYVGKKGIIPILDLVKNVKTVKKLDVSNNMLEHEQLEHLVYCLALHPSIEEINISNNCLHDGSVGHILKLLKSNNNITNFIVNCNDFSSASLKLISEQLENNKIRKLDNQDELIHPYSGKSFRAQLKESLEIENSGGCMHFSTWWKNPQYFMRTSRTTKVRIVMEISDPKAARQAGFIVFYSDGTRKVIDNNPENIAGESTIDHSHCYITMLVKEDTVYTIMPYTFHPERFMSFTLTAELCYDNSTESEGWITLESVDVDLDWIVNNLNGEWTNNSAGGSSLFHTWSHNSMIRIQYAGSTQAYRMASPANIFIKLSKSIDPDINDEKCIGFDVVTMDTTGNETPPIYLKEEFLKCTCPHEHSTTVNSSFVVTCAALDLFIVPSTKIPGELGTYTVTIFSSVPINVKMSLFPHGWNYRAVDGLWDENNCGGSREYSKSWKFNPSLALNFDTKQSSPDVTVFLEASLPSKTNVITNKTKTNSVDKSIIEYDSLSLSEMQTSKELQEFMSRHKSDHIQGCISIVEAIPPFYRTLYLSECSKDSVAHLEVSSIIEEFYILISTRYAGQLGKFKVHIFSSRPFVVGSIETLALRERQSQLMQYTQENEARRMVKLNNMGNKTEIEDFKEVIITRNEILRKCMTTGEKFVDRDFPRGGSSLWLDPELKPPMDFPKQIYWKRPTDVCENAQFLPEWKCDSPFPYSRRDWFASISHALISKPGWLQNVSIGYDIMEGLAQFRFFKDGKWTVVTIDDFLLFDNTMELCMGRPLKDNRDFFFPLLEKSYAKLHRCYEALERKVTPELNIIEVMCQGLLDISGYMSINFPLTSDLKLNQDEQNELWMKMKNAVKPNILFTLILRSESSGASERHNLGILSDHLYPVLDARFIEGQRLVKLRHWGQSSEINWCGKWRSQSNNWTKTLREVLEFNENDNETFWLSFDEVLFYFTDVIMTSGAKNNCWISGDFSDCPKEYNNKLSCGSQFTLSLGDFPQDVKNLQIYIGLHQLDPRTKILRHKEALATYRTSIGLGIVSSEDNTVWLKEIKENNIVKYLEPCRFRDTLCPLNIELDNVSGNKKLTVIAFKENEKSSNSIFLLSAWSDNCNISLIPIKRDEKMKIFGEWPSEYPIGPPSSSFWRDCPQYFIFPSETTEVSIFLHQEIEINKLPKPIGFTIHQATACRSYLNYDSNTVILNVQAEPSACVGGNVRFLGMKERRGMPYIIVPFCTESNPNGKFYIETVSNRSIKISKIDPRLDWHRERRNISFSLSDGSVGGSPRFSSWRSSPQFAIKFPLGSQGKLFISLTNNNANDTLTEIGMILLHGDNQWENGTRRKLVISPEDIISRSEEKIGGVTIECNVNVQPESTLILSIYASMPYREANVNIAIYAADEIEIEKVKEWKHVAVAQGSWELGNTAGGGADICTSWINNPFIALNTFRPTQIVALLIQYPRGPDKPIVKRMGNKKAFLPPVIINPNNRMEIALDLNSQDNELTPIASSSYTLNSEVTLVTSVPPADSLPFLFVPHTKFPEGNGEYKLFVYADSLIELYPITKERIPYV